MRDDAAEVERGDGENPDADDETPLVSLGIASSIKKAGRLTYPATPSLTWRIVAALHS